MTLSSSAKIGLEAFAITHATMWDEEQADNSNELMAALVAEAGSPQDFISALLVAGDFLVRALANSLDDPVESVLAGLLE